MFAIVLILARQPHIHHGQGFCTHIFREQEQFIETHAIGLKIIGIEPVREGVMPAVLV